MTMTQSDPRVMRTHLDSGNYKKNQKLFWIIEDFLFNLRTFCCNLLQNIYVLV